MKNKMKLPTKKILQVEEISDIKDFGIFDNQIKDILKIHYSKYSQNLSQLDPSIAAKFSKDYDIYTIITFDSFYADTLNCFKKANNLFVNLINQAKLEDSEKSLSLKMNYGENSLSKSKISFKFLYNKETHETVFIDRYPELKFIENSLQIVFKLKSTNPKKLKDQIEPVIKSLLILMSIKDPDFQSELLKINYLLNDEFLFIQVNFNWKRLELIFDIFRIYISTINDWNADIELNINFVKSLKDLLDYHKENTILTMINGSKIDFKIKSNFFHLIINNLESIFANSDELLLFNFYAFLNFNANLSLNYSDLEKNYIWDKLPIINIFDQDFKGSKILVDTYTETKDKYPIIKKVVDIVSQIESFVEIGFLTPFGTGQVRFEIEGLTDIWEMLTLIHA